jgi:hypothetical protein
MPAAGLRFKPHSLVAVVCRTAERFLEASRAVRAETVG